MALSPKEKKELQQRFEKQLLPDLDMSFELNGEVYKFNFDKNESGDYIDSFTQAVWGGYQDAEEWEKYGKHQETELPECPEPVEGWCDCDKCKSMFFHKEKNIYVCLSCHKQTEPFLPIDWNSNDYDWLPYEDEY
ncbi:TPA: exodeoxyribonuclease V subunit beta [Escherichia coli]